MAGGIYITLPGGGGVLTREGPGVGSGREYLGRVGKRAECDRRCDELDDCQSFAWSMQKRDCWFKIKCPEPGGAEPHAHTRTHARTSSCTQQHSLSLARRWRVGGWWWTL